MKEYMDAEILQKHHFDAIASDYRRHYNDVWSQKYRMKFINESMLENINLYRKRVIDACCGSGETTGFLLEKGAQVTGVDISQEEMLNFQQFWPNCDAKCASILSTELESNFYDGVIMVGGLHHLHPNVSEAIDEVHRLLKVGGYFCFFEPHAGSLPDIIRKIWYTRDSLFAENEAAIDLKKLKQKFSSKFKFIKEDYKGNIAFLLVYNSLIFRIPLRLKPIYSPLLIWIESIAEKFQGKLLSCVVVCQWQKI